MTRRTPSMSPQRIAAIRERVPLRLRAAARRAVLAIWACGLGFVLLTVYCVVAFRLLAAQALVGLGELGGHYRAAVPSVAGRRRRAKFSGRCWRRWRWRFSERCLPRSSPSRSHFLAAKNTFPFRLAALRRPPLPGLPARRRSADLGADLRPGRRARPACRHHGDPDLRHRNARQAVFGIDREHREEARGRRAGFRRRPHSDAALRRSSRRSCRCFSQARSIIFESNVRSATILGIVGAGGIGFQLSDRIRAHHWEEASFILIVILVTVACIDWLSKQLRMRLIGQRS